MSDNAASAVGGVPVSGSRAGLYARVSSEQQAKENTIASQLEALKQRMRQDGTTLEEELCFIDEGYSGSTLLRPSLERLRDVAAAGGLDRLYVHSPDRLARKYAYQVLLIDEWRRCGAPYGYHYLREHEGGGEASYQVRLEEARVVRQIFEWVAGDRLSIGEVCRRLGVQAVPSPRGKNYWDRSTVWAILKNPAYKGSAAFGKTRIGERRPRLRAYRGQAEQPRRAYSTYDVPCDEWISIPVPPIVGEEVFDAVAEQLAENRARNRQTKRGVRYLLQGLLVCRCCGHAFYGKPLSLRSRKGKYRDYAYYRCIGMDAYRFGGQRICDNRQVRTDMIEEAVWSDVCVLLNEPQRIEREYERRLNKEGENASSPSDQQLAAVIQRVQRGIARLIDAYEDGLIERTEFEPRIKTTKSRLEKLQAEAQALAEDRAQEQQLRLVIGQLQEFAGKVGDGVQHAAWTTRRDLIRTLVKRVEIDKEDVRIVYRLSPSSPSTDPTGAIMQHCRRGDLSFAALEDKVIGVLRHFR